MDYTNEEETIQDKNGNIVNLQEYETPKNTSGMMPIVNSKSTISDYI
jgi:hypothetical protein